MAQVGKVHGLLVVRSCSSKMMDAFQHQHQHQPAVQQPPQALQIDLMATLTGGKYRLLPAAPTDGGTLLVVHRSLGTGDDVCLSVQQELQGRAGQNQTRRRKDAQLGHAGYWRSQKNSNPNMQFIFDCGVATKGSTETKPRRRHSGLSRASQPASQSYLSLLLPEIKHRVLIKLDCVEDSGCLED